MIEQWQSNQPATFTCVKKWAETDDAVSILLTPERPQHQYDFKPGQFVSLGVNISDKIEYRAYSISSQPDDNHLQLTIKKVSDGKISSYIVDHFSEGDTIQVLKPAGEFNCIDSAEQGINKPHVLFISAGCGITPVYSMANYLLRHCPDLHITFLHSAKSKQHTIYYKQLTALDHQYDRFELKLLLKDAGDTEHPQGRLNQSLLLSLVPNLNEQQVFLCGPNQFMLDVEHYLNNVQFDMRYFQQESFTPITAESIGKETEQNTPPIHTGKVQLRVPDFNVDLEIESGSTLVDSLEENQLPIIVACRSGICGSCRCKVVKGNVTSSSQETLTDEEIKQGYVLACSTTIESDVEISF